MSESIARELRDGVLHVTLDRPQKLNALTFAMFEELLELAAEAERDHAVRVLVLTGAGRGFCSGLDLDDAERLAGMTAQEMLAGQEVWAGAVAALRKLSKPVVAAVNGPAAGAGLGLALAADVRMASPEASFIAAFVRIGLTGGDVGVSWMLPRVVGLGHASEMLLTARTVGAEEAARIGLVNRVVGAEELLDEAHLTAASIAAHTPFGVRLTKRVLQANVDAPSLEAAIELENRNQVLSTRDPDMPEALAAFRERREPRFTSA